jgi:hypothetical protein
VALPTYFIASSDRTARSAEPPDISASTHIVDVFRTAEGGERSNEWVVTVDALGSLQAFRCDERAAFPQALQSELAFQELISSNASRVLHVREFYLIGARYLDQPAQAPGVNDPVQLFGTLYGPYRNVQDFAINALDGQLTLTRADLLDALLRGAPHAFRYPSPSGENRNAPRCLHMALPLDREEAIADGRGVALAYLLMPADLMLSDAANEVLAAQMIYELLSAFKQDFRKEAPQHPLVGIDLPVPSRPILERQLQAEGYVIQGEEAIKQSAKPSTFTGFLASVFGVNEKRLKLPAEGRLEDFLRLAHITLQALPGWPTPRAAALRQRVGSLNPAPERPVPRPAPSPPPASSEPPQQAPKPVTQPRPPKDAVVWTKPGTKSSRPDWMEDFTEPVKKEPVKKQPDRSPKSGGRAGEKDEPDALRKRKPDWMKDFE